MKQALQFNECVVHENSIVHLKLTASWKDDSGQHTVVQHIEKFNVWRDMDLLPETILKDLLHQEVGKSEKHHFVAGEFYLKWSPKLVKELPLKNFNGRLRSGEVVQPRTGRYYPKGWISGVEGVYSENMFPVRIVDIYQDTISVDFNHPLARHDLDIGVEIVDIFPPSDEHGGRCSDAIETTLANGPGMQLPVPETATDFFVENAIRRIDEDTDDVFYQQPRMVHHLDANARYTISKLYGELIKPGSRVLDLMASWESHLPTDLVDVDVSGLGMNHDELQANPQINNSLVHDLNTSPTVPYDDGMFDAVICTASIEYLINPIKVFEEVRRTLKPGGVCIISFSNRWFPSKAIALWSEMHEFERMGLVMEYFRHSGWQGDVDTFSNRGLHRPEDDPHYAQTQMSDPVYAVWSYK
jgi:FKBP-type peptidyl-prolyl cis-trans isomerase 2/SAM-dependent methyltransferase